LRFVQYHVRAASGDGGITNSVRRLSEGLAGAGAETVIVCADDAPPPSLRGVEWRQVPHRGIGRTLVPTGLEEAFAGADVVVLNSAWTVHNLVAGRAARRAGVPYVLAPRGAYDPRILRRRRWAKRAWLLAGERDLIRRCRAIHAFFESERADLAAVGHDGPVIVAPNGVAAPDGLRADGSGGYLLYLGRFDPEHKGLDLLIRAVAAIPAGSLPPLRLHGPDWRGGKARVEALIAELGIGDRVTVGEPAHDEAKWRLIAGATGFVYPSRWEGFGNSTAEACALGVPTLVTPYPLGRYLAARDAAILAEATVPGLIDGLQRLVHPDARQVGTNAAAVVRSEFTWDAVARSWLRQVEILAGVAA
jgi:glycosyltransferase involved in cell wall biosynthesis